MAFLRKAAKAEKRLESRHESIARARGGSPGLKFRKMGNDAVWDVCPTGLNRYTSTFNAFNVLLPGTMHVL